MMHNISLVTPPCKALRRRPVRQDNYRNACMHACMYRYMYRNAGACMHMHAHACIMHCICMPVHLYRYVCMPACLHAYVTSSVPGACKLTYMHKLKLASFTPIKLSPGTDWQPPASCAHCHELPKGVSAPWLALSRSPTSFLLPRALLPT